MLRPHTASKKVKNEKMKKIGKKKKKNQLEIMATGYCTENVPEPSCTYSFGYKLSN